MPLYETSFANKDITGTNKNTVEQHLQPQVGRFNSSIKVIYYDNPEEDEDWTLMETLNQNGTDICPLVKTEEQLKFEERERIKNMSESQLV